MKIERKCPHCLIVRTIEVDENQYKEWKAGKLIQRAFPNLNSSQRETLITGICPECWSKIFGDDEYD